MSENNKFSILSILEAIEKIKEYKRVINSANDLFNNKLIMDACLMNFIVIGEMVSKMDDTFKIRHQDIEWNKIKNFRNIIAHNYFGISAEEIWQIIINKLPKLEARLKEIIIHLV